VRWENWLLIRTYHTGLKDFPEYMLFDVESDPHETANLVATHPDVLGEGLRLMDEWVGGRMYRGQRGDPFWGVIAEDGPRHANANSQQWRDYLVRLRATGRGHHADGLEAYGGRPMRSGLEV